MKIYVNEKMIVSLENVRCVTKFGGKDIRIEYTDNHFGWIKYESTETRDTAFQEIASILEKE